MDSRHKELHDRANELLFKHHYSQAAQLYSELLESLQQTGQLAKGLKDLHISCLNKRATCHMKLVSTVYVIDILSLQVKILKGMKDSPCSRNYGTPYAIPYLNTDLILSYFIARLWVFTSDISIQQYLRVVSVAQCSYQLFTKSEVSTLLTVPQLKRNPFVTMEKFKDMKRQIYVMSHHVLLQISFSNERKVFIRFLEDWQCQNVCNQLEFVTLK